MVELHEYKFEGNYEKPDIVEVATELGYDLKEHHGDKPYLSMLCPFHNNTKTPAFFIFPNVQWFYCYNCLPEGGDVFTLYMMAKGVSFREAQEQIGRPIPVEEAFDKYVDSVYKEPKLDLMPYSVRANNLFETLDFLPSVRVLSKLEKALEMGRSVEADLILKTAGV